MALPKLNVPVYEAILPSTEKVIKYRPFLVKEEKLLFTAQESGEEAVLPAVKQIIKNCVQGELDIDNMPLFDIEYLFLRLRAKSVGEEVTLGLKPWGCPQNNGELCEFTTEVSVNLEEIKCVKDKKHTSKIMLDDNIGIMMKYPDISQMNIKETENDAMGMKIIKNSINMIFTEEETHERGSFTEKELDDFVDSLNTKQLDSIRNFFETMPTLKHTVKYKCGTCKEEKETTVQGLQSFFG
ncbi:uncharacterized protein METZ01_LOCUS211464 [marine metagenome]|uniref:Baseplate protein n=1 Tax=marine metagenome TaxID=408172 RepID=A0A382F6M3_9ZZZZ